MVTSSQQWNSNSKGSPRQYADFFPEDEYLKQLVLDITYLYTRKDKHGYR
jgi:hypothetical protein